MTVVRYLAISLLVFCLLAWISILVRFDLKTVAGRDGYAQAYRLDRLTGEMTFILEDQAYPVVQGNPDDLESDVQGSSKGHL